MAADAANPVSGYWIQFVITVVGGVIVYLIGERLKAWLFSEARQKRRGKNKLQRLEAELEELKDSVANRGRFALNQFLIYLSQTIALLCIGIYLAVSFGLSLWRANPAQPIEPQELAIRVFSLAILLFWTVLYNALAFNRVRKVAWPNIRHKGHLENRIEQLREEFGQ